DRIGFVGIASIVVWALSPSAGFSQVPGAQSRIPQQIVINGQMASGAHVMTAGGQVQNYSCPSPQHYTTADGSAEGWACYEQSTGVWLLNALPPANAQVTPVPAPVPAQPAPQQPQVIYQAPPAVVYQQAPPVVVYPQPAPAVIYQQPPAVIYQQPPTTVVY